MAPRNERQIAVRHEPLKRVPSKGTVPVMRNTRLGNGRREPHLRALVVTIGVALLVVAQAGAAPPPSGTLVEGVGGGGAVLGAPLAPVRQAWGLTCRKASSAGNGVCHRLDRRGRLTGGITLWYDANGRIEALDVTNPRWRTRRGLAPGDRIPRVRALYGKAVPARLTRVWSYFEVEKRIGGQLRRTLIIGRTKVGDIWSVTVLRALETRLTATRPAEGGVVVTATGMAPRYTGTVQVLFPWLKASFPIDLGMLRADRTGRAELRDPPGGLLDRQLALRPAGLTGPVTALIKLKELDYSSAVRPARAISTSIALPLAIPRLSVSPRVTDNGTLTVQVDGAETGASYSLAARWTCADGRAVQREINDPDEALARGGSTRTANLSVRDIAIERRDTACAGPAVTADLPVTVVLLRAVGTGSQDLGEAVAQADIVLAPS